MRRRIWGVRVLAPVAVGVSFVAVAACFPDPPADDGIPDTGIFTSDGSLPQSDAALDGAVDASPASGLTLSATTLDFGLAECGGVAPAPQTITLTNTSSGTITYGAAASGNDFAVVAPATGQLVAGAKIALQITSTGVSSFAQAGGLIEGALQIVTDAPGQKLFVVDLKKTAAGAQLVMIPNDVNFGLIDTDATLNVGFRNVGNQPLGIVFDQPPFYPFGLQSDDDAGAGITVPPGTTTTLQASMIYNNDSETSADVSFTTTGVLCGGGDPPSSIHLHGQPTLSFPQASITPGIVTFDVGGGGFVPCGQTAGARTVTVANSVMSETPDVVITKAQITGGNFTVSPAVDTSDGGIGIDLAQGGTQVFTITPKPVTAPSSTMPNALSGSLDIELSNGSSYTVDLSQTAQGAELSFSPNSITFPPTSVDSLAQQILGVSNNGNAAVGIQLSITGSPYFSVSPSSQFSINTPGGSSTVSFLPIATGVASGTLSLKASGPVCVLPSPAAVSLAGNGVAAVDAGAPADAGVDAD